MKAIIEDGKVINGPLLRRYWAERNRRHAIIRRGMFRDLTEFANDEPETPLIVQHVHHQIMSSKDFDMLVQTKRKVDFLEKNITTNKPFVKKYEEYDAEESNEN
ncbi:hypothetical protein LCGC14_1145910 [marine sediment metagenome]|uniref:Uncharacterized protein n=1 Tax=marine sediment metagenome TaxID=412755 RepID=A0A0F9Q2K8_9ZZZZ